MARKARKTVEEWVEELEDLHNQSEWQLLHNEARNFLSTNSNNAMGHYYLGKALFNQKEFIKAVIEFNNAISFEGENADFYYWCGLAKAKNKELEGALANLNDAVRINSKNKEYLVDRGILLHQLARPEDAIRDLSIALKLDNDTYLAATALGMIYFDQTNYDMANQYIKQAINSSPNNAEALTIAGLIQMETGDLNDAEKVFTEAINNNPRLADAYIGRGNCRASLNKQKDAEADFSKALEISPSILHIHKDNDFFSGIQNRINKMHILSSQGNWEDLEAVASQLRGRFSLIPHGYFYEGIAIYKMGDFEEALNNFGTVLEKTPNSLEAYRWRAASHRQLKNFNAALEDVNRALELGKTELGKTDFESLMLRSLIYMSMEKFELAQSDINEVISGSYKTSVSKILSGRIKLAQNQLEGATSDFMEALNLSSQHNNSEARFYLGLIAMKREQFQPASGHFDSVIASLHDKVDHKLRTIYGKARLERAHCKLSLEFPEDALLDIEEAIKILGKTSYLLEVQGNIFDKMERYEEALNSYDKAIDLDDTNNSAARRRATTANKLAHQQTRLALTEQHEASFQNITDSHEIIVFYETEISYSESRLYGEDGKSGLAKEKEDALLHLPRWVAFIWLIAVAYFYGEACGFWTSENGCTIDNNFEGAFFRLSATLLFLSTPFFINIRHKIKIFNEERIILHSLRREKIALMFLNAQPPDLPEDQRTKLTETVLILLKNNSVADISLGMMHPKTLGTNDTVKETNSNDRLSDIAKAIKDHTPKT